MKNRNDRAYIKEKCCDPCQWVTADDAKRLRTRMQTPIELYQFGAAVGISLLGSYQLKMIRFASWITAINVCTAIGFALFQLFFWTIVFKDMTPNSPTDRKENADANRYSTTTTVFGYGQDVELTDGFYRGCKAAVVDYVPAKGYTVEVYSGLWFGENAIGGTRYRKPPLLQGVPEASLRPLIGPGTELKTKPSKSSEA